MALTSAGAVAFSRTGEPTTGGYTGISFSDLAGSGGDGAGLGGAVFVASGGTLVISGDSTLIVTATDGTDGTDGTGTAASAFGGGIFYQGTENGAATQLNVGAGGASPT